MPLIIHHYYPLGSENVGDHMVARAIGQAVPRFFGPCEFFHFPVNDRYQKGDRTLGLLGDNLERTNAQADLVIIGGSNLLEPRKARRKGLFQRQGRWSIFTDVDSIHRLNVPLLLLGMGTGSSFGKRIRKFIPPALDEVRLLHQKAFASAVRDVTTVRHLKSVGIQTQCTGCPVTFLTDAPVTGGSNDQPLLVSFPPITITTRPLGTSFMRNAMEYIAWLRDQRVPVIVTLHDSKDQDPAKYLVPKGVEIFYTANLDEQIARFKNSRGVIGFRLHAALLGLGLGKPVIPVGLDWRGLAFIETFDAEPWSIRAFRFGQFTKLRTLTKLLLQNDEQLISHLAAKKSQLQSNYETFLSHAASQLEKVARRDTVVSIHR